MFIRVKTTPNSPRKSVQIVESVRRGLKVSQKIVRYVGIAMDDIEVEKLRDLAAEIIIKMQQQVLDTRQPSFFDPEDIPSREEEIAIKIAKIKRGRPKRKSLTEVLTPDKVALTDVVEESRIVEGVHEVAGHFYDYLGFDKAITGKSLSSILKNIVLLRAFDPASKLKSSDILARDFDIDNKVDAIYRMMDKVHPNIANIKTLVFNQTLSLFPQKINMVLFDVTTLYFESTEVDDLRAFGYSKDQKFNTTQVVLALATNDYGLPIGYELFPGNKAEVSTLLECINKWKESFAIGAVTIIADRAMCSRENMVQLEKNGIGFIVAAPIRRFKDSFKETILADFADIDIITHKEYDFEGKRLIVSYCPDRARKDSGDRKRLLDKLVIKLKSGKVKKLVSNKGYLKYINETETDNKISINQAKVDSDARWDGLHAIITLDKEASVGDLLESYHRLWVIEESFRINKHNLGMRPIYHFKQERIEAHIAICYMAFAIIRQLQYRIRIAQENISINKIREELLNVQSSIYVHKDNHDRYRMPGRFSQTATKIYRALGIKRNADVGVYIK